MFGLLVILVSKDKRRKVDWTEEASAAFLTWKALSCIVLHDSVSPIYWCIQLRKWSPPFRLTESTTPFVSWARRSRQCKQTGPPSRRSVLPSWELFESESTHCWTPTSLWGPITEIWHTLVKRLLLSKLPDGCWNSRNLIVMWTNRVINQRFADKLSRCLPSQEPSHNG